MFRKEVKSIGELILKNLRSQGLETPLQQKRLIAAWPEVMGEMIAGYTQDLYIRNQTLNVRLTNPALRADLSLMRPEILLEVEADADSPTCKSRQEPVVVAFAPPQAMPLCIKGDSGDEGYIYLLQVGKGSSRGFHDMIGTLGKILRSRIAPQFHRGIIKHLRQQHRLPLRHEFIKQPAGIHLIRQGIIGQDYLGLTEQRTQALKDRKRQFLQLCWGELSLLL